MNELTTTPSNPSLIEVLEEAAKRKGLNKQQLALALGVTYSYYAQLKSGLRDTKQISDSFAEQCARFLGVPRIKVLLSAGKITASDFYEVASEDEFRLNVWKALDFIKADTDWGPYFPYQLLNAEADPVIQQFVVLLYEKATGKVLLGERFSTQDLTVKLHLKLTHLE
ncbi:helix-turn-helix domain-containing protein [Sulfuriferula nivalis]|uniref:HTH cro/C1-type domain-containing protein n=1 Tax=Sulfuriferula nivalis TaxID=2675298 RepID=A0A809S916_9PROT|nr:helix-turn-helix transcriptional regulator [Sulfuriferula nivalis]BBP00602.1 hypothetical protein SFSGTM_13100 [Sulfuriferula nivalis]